MSSPVIRPIGTLLPDVCLTSVCLSVCVGQLEQILRGRLQLPEEEDEDEEEEEDPEEDDQPQQQQPPPQQQQEQQQLAAAAAAPPAAVMAAKKGDMDSGMDSGLGITQDLTSACELSSAADLTGGATGRRPTGECRRHCTWCRVSQN